MILIILLLFSFLYYRIYSLYHIGIPCIFHKITGLYCPGCGITRTLFSLINFDFKSAFRNNILILIVCPFLLYYVIHKIYDWINFKPERNIFPPWVWNTLLIITIIFGILRNLPWFDFLKPLV